MLDYRSVRKIAQLRCVGSAIQPDHRNLEFFRHVTTKRRSSSAMLDETLLGKAESGGV